VNNFLQYIYHSFVVLQLYVCSLQYVVSLLFAYLCHFVIIRFVCFDIFRSCFLFYFFYFVYSVFLFCVLFFLLHTAVSFLFLYKFTESCHLVETQLQLVNIVPLPSKKLYILYFQASPFITNSYTRNRDKNNLQYIYYLYVHIFTTISTYVYNIKVIYFYVCIYTHI